LTIPGGITQAAIASAYARANAIAADIALGKFDSSLMAYDPNRFGTGVFLEKNLKRLKPLL